MSTARTMFDLAVIGSGFAGSLVAMIAKRLGHSVLLIERGRHPRFAIGESSTPLANLILEELATRYDLPALLPFTKWGTWQRSRPQIACGLKRGFSFFHHRLGDRWLNDADRADQLLVGASPNNEIADTHWYRPEFDEYFAQAAADMGVTYVDQLELDAPSFNGDRVELQGRRNGRPERFHARFIIDATGPRGFLHRTLRLREAAMPSLPETEGLYAHFEGVRGFSDVTEGCFEGAPYPIDDAAVHHVFDGGWIWVLRFNNGVTSAGVAATAARAQQWDFDRGKQAWLEVIRDLPGVAPQFCDARAVTAFYHNARLSFRSSRWAGHRWTLLPSAGGFIDPLLSTGFPLTLLGIGRLAKAIDEDWDTDRFAARVSGIAHENEADFLAAEQLVAALYAQMHDFPTLRALTLLYFAAASFSETARRLERNDLTEGFLLRGNSQFAKGLRKLCSRAIAGIAPSEREHFSDDIVRFIEPFNIAGLGIKERRHWYPAEMQDLVANAAKLGASKVEIRAMIARVLGHEGPIGV